MAVPVNPMRAPLSNVEHVLLHRRGDPSRLPALTEDRDFCQRSLRDLVSNSNHGGAGFELCVHLPLAETPATHTGRRSATDRSVRQYLDHLLIEIRALGSLIDHRRPLSNMHWSGDALRWLSPAELTELMYTIARCFHLQHDHPRTYTAEIDHLPSDDSLLALLCGLGFNEVNLGSAMLKPNSTARANLKLLCEKLQRFGVTTICSRLPKSDRLITTNVDKELSELRNTGITSLWLNPSSQHRDNQCIRDALQRNRWHPISAIEYHADNHKKPTVHTTSLGAGLGACTFVDRNFSRNHSGLNHYYAAVSDGKLPSATGGYIKHHAF